MQGEKSQDADRSIAGAHLFRPEAMQHQRQRLIGAAIEFQPFNWLLLALPVPILALLGLALARVEYRPRLTGRIAAVHADTLQIQLDLKGRSARRIASGDRIELALPNQLIRYAVVVGSAQRVECSLGEGECTRIAAQLAAEQALPPLTIPGEVLVYLQAGRLLNALRI